MARGISMSAFSVKGLLPIRRTEITTAVSVRTEPARCMDFLNFLPAILKIRPAEKRPARYIMNPDIMGAVALMQG